MRNLRHGYAASLFRSWRWCFACALSLSGLSAGALPLAAQRVVRAPEQVVSVSKGASALLVNTTPIQRFSIGDPTVAEAVVVSPTEVLVNGKTLGTTSLFLWDNTGNIKLYSVEVTADAPGLQRYLSSVLAGEKIDVIASGNVVTLSGPCGMPAWRIARSRSPRAPAPSSSTICPPRRRCRSYSGSGSLRSTRAPSKSFALSWRHSIRTDSMPETTRARAGSEPPTRTTRAGLPMA